MEPIHERLNQHMAVEEAFQREVAESLKDPAVALATVATRLENHEKTSERLLLGVERMDSRLDGHEQRLLDVERSMSQAATVLKWFGGGGFLAMCASAYFLFRLVATLGEILKELPK